MNHKLITLDGLDNCGKSKGSKLLAVEMTRRGFPTEVIKTPLPMFVEASRIINKDATTDTHHLFHAAMVKYAEQIVTVMLKSTSVVCDRWFYTTEAYHRAAGSSLDLTCEALMSRRPDYAFLLLVDEEERMRRGRLKGNTAEKHDLVEKSQSPILEIAEKILQTFGLHEIDTTHMTEEEVVNLMADVICK